MIILLKMNITQIRHIKKQNMNQRGNIILILISK